MATQASYRVSQEMATGEDHDHGNAQYSCVCCNTRLPYSGLLATHMQDKIHGICHFSFFFVCTRYKNDEAEDDRWQLLATMCEEMISLLCCSKKTFHFQDMTAAFEEKVHREMKSCQKRYTTIARSTKDAIFCKFTINEELWRAISIRLS